MTDSVNHPKHYAKHPSEVECIQITEHMSFCLGNAVKYIWRAGEKENSIEDLKKAIWYIERAKRRNPFRKLFCLIFFPELPVDFLIAKYMAYEKLTIKAGIVHTLFDCDLGRKNLNKYRKAIISAINNRIEVEEFKKAWKENPFCAEEERI